MKINPRLWKALETRGLAEPTLAQSSAWPVIASGSNVLLPEKNQGSSDSWGSYIIFYIHNLWNYWLD